MACLRVSAKLMQQNLILMENGFAHGASIRNTFCLSIHPVRIDQLLHQTCIFRLRCHEKTDPDT